MRPMAGLLVAVTIAAVSVQLTAQQPPPPPAPQGARAGEAPGRPGGPAQGRGRGQLGGAAAGFVQNPTYDTDAPVLPADLKPGGVLIFSKTNGFRDEPAIQASNAALAAIATMRGWPSFVTENAAVMNPAQLTKFALVVWNNSSGDVLDPAQRTAFQQWVEQGGSYLGIHGAGGDPVVSPGHTSLADWKWYVDTLVGAQFVVHSSIMPGDIHVEDTKSPIMKGLPALWHRSEEWYAFEEPRSKPASTSSRPLTKELHARSCDDAGGSPAGVVALRREGDRSVYSARTRGRLLLRAVDDSPARQRDGLAHHRSGRPCRPLRP